MTDPKLFFLVCEYFAGEVAAVLKAEEFDDVGMASFPSHCARPTTWDSLKKVIPPPDKYGRVYILISCCAAALGDPPPGLEHCHVHNLGQCFHMLADRSLVETWQKEGAYLLSRGWLARWRDRIEEWGFDQKTAREFLGESVVKLLLLDTGVDEKSPDRLTEFAEFVDLPSERLPVGLDFLRLFLSKVLLETELKNEKTKKTAALADKDRKLADYGIALDLLGKLIQTTTEKETIENIQNIFSMLFAPGKLVYIPVTGGQPVKAQVSPADAVNIESLQNRLSNSNEQYAWAESGNGFVLRITHRDETLGIMVIDEIAFPEHKERYVNLALFIADVCGIAIDNARTYQEIKLAEEKVRRYSSKLEKSNEEIKQFANIISHDLRSPLVNLKGFSHELKNVCEHIHKILKEVSPHFTEDQRKRIKNLCQEDMPEALGFIDSSTSTMDRLVSNILDLSRAGRRKLNFEEIETNKLVKGKLKTLHHQIETRGIKIKLKELPNVVADESALDQIFGNILSNAVNYLNQDRLGTIEISGKQRASDVLFSVKDNGRGIAEEDFYKVFELFRRAGKPNVPGDGMGLAYTKTLVERHGGEIWFESEEGVGTTFYFTILDRHGEQRTLNSR